MITTQEDRLARYLLGKTRSAVLSLLYLQPEESLFVREIIRAVDTGSGAVQRELENLAELGLIVRRESGKQVYYQAAVDHPVTADLTRFLVKTTGISVIVQNALLDLEDRIDVAFFYGSIARGDLRRESDVDLMIVGSVSVMDVSRALSDIEESVGREINPSVFPPAEFQEKVQSGHHFLKTVLEDEKIMLIGGEDELGRLAGTSVAD